MGKTMNDNEAEAFEMAIKMALNCDPKEFSKKYKAYKKAEEEFNKLYEPIKEQIINIYSKAQEYPNTFMIDDVKVTYVSPSVRTGIDSKKLKEEEPEIAKKFTKLTSVSASLRLEKF